MNNQEIIDKAPPNTSIVDSEFKFFDDIYCELNEEGEWNWKNAMPKYPIRSLADIKRITDLERSLKIADCMIENQKIEITNLNTALKAGIKRIIELETYLQKVQADRINDIAIERKRWAKADLVALEILRLEQQIKGADRVYEEMEIYSSCTDIRGSAQRVISRLRNKLKLLKETQ
jgi:hypothetical protein